MNQPVARQVAGRYSFWGTSNELATTFPLATDETVLAEGSIRLRTGFLGRPGDLRLTDHRLAIVSHYFFQPDRGFELPRGSITRFERTGSALTLVYRSPGGEARMTFEEHFLLPEALAQWWRDAPGH